MKAKNNGIIFCDLDGVLADCGHRLHFAKNGDKNKFYSAEEIENDPIIFPGAELLMMFKNTGRKIIFVSSRRESCRKATKEWLLRLGLVDYELYLKRPGDEREPWEVKKDLLHKAIRKNKDLYLSRFHYYIDDYSKNCRMVMEEFSDRITPLHFCRKMR